MYSIKGLTTHENSKTFEAMSQILDDLGYDVIASQVLKAAYDNAPQKRERLFGREKTGVARCISWDEPCLTLTTSPA